MAAPLASGSDLFRPQWLFRTYSRRVRAHDPLRQFWKRLCPNTHLWFEAIASESMPQAAVLARFTSFEICREISPAAEELFTGPAGNLAGWNILEFQRQVCGAVRFRKRTLKNSQCVLIGFDSLSERWRSREGYFAGIALFRAEPG